MRRYGQHAANGFVECIEDAYLLWRAKYDYYQKDSPTLSDTEFDQLERKVNQWELDNQVRLIASPTQQVGYSEAKMVEFCQRYGFEYVK